MIFVRKKSERIVPNKNFVQLKLNLFCSTFSSPSSLFLSESKMSVANEVKLFGKWYEIIL